ncbi:hypothetical protein NESM_000461100 [Novymonas esmeraldas]|uniref:Uncharacterized protein n=1 Tax=Novymonas esmeraldas TaxID=1808958 RepID=A0AAW0ENX3_9TRYP
MTGPSRGGQRGGRQRGGRGGRGEDHPPSRRGPHTAPPAHRTDDAAATNVEQERRPGLESECDSIAIPHAFEGSCAHVPRCREKGRLFRLPLVSPAAGGGGGGEARQEFAVVERTIGGIDDVVYSKHRDVWERLPRGNARVYVRTDSAGGGAGTAGAGDRFALVGAANGLRKFGYDDSTYGYPDAVDTVIAVEKENGECGHLSAFTLPPSAEETSGDMPSHGAAAPSRDSSRFWVVGSKNVHIVVDYAVSEEGLRYYGSLGRRYTYAIKIARLWRALLTDGGDDASPTRGRLTAAQTRSFHDALCSNQWTCCFESIFSDSEHLVDYNGVNELRFYAVTQNRRAFDVAGADHTVGAGGAAAETATTTGHGAPQHSLIDGLCIPVADAVAFYAGVGLTFSHHSPPVPFKSVEYEQLIDSIARRTNSEGCVMYGANAAGTVVRLWKEKSYPYVMERATREAITNHKIAGTDLRKRLQTKLAHQQPQLRVYFKHWEANRMPWLLHFAAWLQMTRRLTPHMQRDELFPLRNQWLSLQRSFQASLDTDPELSGVCAQYQPDPVQWGTDAQNLDVVKFVGAQGCGKSTLSRAFYALLTTKANHTPRWVNQDECGNRTKFLSSLRQATHATSKVTHLLIDKMNLDAKMNEDYNRLPLSLTVTWFHPDGENALYGVCIDRVLGRGSGHRTIRVDPSHTPQEQAAQVQNIRSFVRKAVGACEAPRDPEEVVLELDITAPLSEMVRLMWGRLQETGTHPLPPITEEDIHDAIALAHRYETLLCDLPQAPIYACIAVEDASEAAKLRSVVPAALTAAQVVQPLFHLTTKYFGAESDPVAFVSLATRLGQTVTLTLDCVIADGNGVAVTVRRDDALYPCANPIPHFTIANRQGVPPKYSNELISPTAYPGNPAERTVVQLPPNHTVTGVFRFR